MVYAVVILSIVSFSLLLLFFSEKKKREKLEVEKQFLQNELQHKGEVFRLVEQTQNQMKESFSALSSNVLEKSSKQFLDLANLSFEKAKVEAKSNLTHLIEPMKQTLEQFDQKVHQMEKKRSEEFVSIKQQMSAMMELEKTLKSETASLSRALHSPTTRGRWGEIQLKKVVEMAGMVEHCDFVEQPSFGQEDVIRPDLVVHLPGGKQIIVDSKAPLEGYLQSIEVEDEGRRKQLIEKHAKDVKARVKELSKKSYWDRLEQTPEFVVLFLPGEMFFSAAVKNDPGLIEFGIDNGVILATPTTLIALLRSVAYGWRQESISEHAMQIFDLAKELYKRLSDLGGHWSKLGKDLKQAMTAYNKATGTLESRVFPQARKFEELGVVQKNKLPELQQVEGEPRALPADLEA